MNAHQHIDNTRTRHGANKDRGNILPLVLVATVVLGIVVVAVATYSAANLRYGQVVEARAERISAAQGGMDDLIETLTLKNPICTSAGTAGVDIPFPELVNGASVVVNCRVAGKTLPPLDGWAIVITGEGKPNSKDPLFEIDNSALVEIGGPVYLQYPAQTDLKSNKGVQIVDGDLYHPGDATCAGAPNPGDPLEFQPSSLTITNLSYTAGGPNCINRTWKQLFDPGNTNGPPVPASITDVPTSLPTNPLPATVGTCTVFQPGIYDDSFDLQKKLGASNYFLSGIYLFDDIGKIELKNKIVTMGQIDRQGYPAIANTACDNVRTAAVPVTGFPAEDGKGATLYTKGDTYFTSQSNSGFEISGRLQGTANVSLQVLTSTLKFNEPLLTSDNGNHKEVAMQGIVWAPYNSLLYETVPADKAAMLRGGAVVASYRGKVAASASGFLIEVATKPGDARLLIESTATDTRGSNTVRVVADYRPSTGELAVHSRRVVK